MGHELAIKYNDRSPLENMRQPKRKCTGSISVASSAHIELPRHCAVLYQLLARPETELFGSLSDEDYKEALNALLDRFRPNASVTFHLTSQKGLGCPKMRCSYTGSAHLRRDHLAHGHGMWGSSDFPDQISYRDV